MGHDPYCKTILLPARAAMCSAAKRDRVKVLWSEQPHLVGGIGSIKGVQNDDCILRMEGDAAGVDAADQMCIADVHHVGKLAVQLLGQ